MTAQAIEPLVQGRKAPVLLQAQQGRRTAIALPVAIMVVVKGVALRPGMLGDAIDNPKDKTKDLVEPAAGKQGPVAAVVHQRKAARRKKN